jgi:peptidoglycan/LPS O-acetylase OafA/YrhL
MAHNPSIHGLRGLAAAMVVVLHLYGAVLSGGFPVRMEPNGLVGRVLSAGHRGVEFFFLISGYLIVASLVRHRSVPRFLYQRAVRIYPAFLVPHLLIFAVGPWIGYRAVAGLDGWTWMVHFVSNLLMLPGFFDLPIANIVAWTLSLELAFYLLAAWAAVLVRPPDETALASSLTGQVARTAMGLAWLLAAGTALSWHPRMWFFVAGAAVYELERRWIRDTTNAANANARGWIGILALVGLCVLFDRSLVAALACGLVGLLTVVRQRGLLAHILRTRPLQYLGDISYSLYLWHAVVLFPLKRLFGRPGGIVADERLNVALFLVAAAFASILVAHLSYQWIEEWFTTRYLRRGESWESPEQLSMPTFQRAA